MSSDACETRKFPMKCQMEKIEIALEAFREGDRIGAPWESGAADWRPVSYDEIMSRRGMYPNGTDESDIVDCFREFSRRHQYGGDISELLVSWCRHHLRNRRVTSYGKTWKDHFATIKYLDKSGKLNLQKIYAISSERKPGGSAGNGCLALALPVYSYAIRNGLEPVSLVQSFFRLSHASVYAAGCAEFLCSVFDCATGRSDGKTIEASAKCPPIKTYYLEKAWEWPPETFAKTFPNNMLSCVSIIHALYALHHSSSEQDLICRVIGMHGDADSVLALALMLYRLQVKELGCF